jgi:hypothetical protein
MDGWSARYACGSTSTDIGKKMKISRSTPINKRMQGGSVKYIVAGLMVALAGCSGSDSASRPAVAAQAVVTPSAPPTEAEKQKALDTVFGNLHSTKVVRPSAPDKKP